MRRAAEQPGVLEPVDDGRRCRARCVEGAGHLARGDSVPHLLRVEQQPHEIEVASAEPEAPPHVALRVAECALHTRERAQQSLGVRRVRAHVAASSRSSLPAMVC